MPSIGVRTDVPFVGRANQRELLSSVMSMVANGRSAVVAVTGEAGSGKTRLVSEMLADLPEPVGRRVRRDLRAVRREQRVGTDRQRVVPADEPRPGGADRGAARDESQKGIEYYRFDDDDPVLDLFVETVLHLMGHPSTFDSMAPSRARETLFSVVVEGLRRRSQHGPIVMWLDDLQWADKLVIDLLGRITRSLVDRAVLVITAQRDDVDIDWPPATDHPITIRMPLDPLSRDEAHVLVEAMLGDANNHVLADQLYERSGGNPLFLTELATMTSVDPDSTDAAGLAAGADRVAARPARARTTCGVGQRVGARHLGRA